MFVRLATDWTGPGETRHRAGDLVEVDNVTLAELEAGGFVATDETSKSRKPKQQDAPEQDKTRTEPEQPDQPEQEESGGGIEPASWPGIS